MLDNLFHMNVLLVAYISIIGRNKIIKNLLYTGFSISI